MDETKLSYRYPNYNNDGRMQLRKELIHTKLANIIWSCSSIDTLELRPFQSDFATVIRPILKNVKVRHLKIRKDACFDHASG